MQGVEHEAWCGSVRRPLDPAAPQGTQIDVHFAVLPALARNRKPDPVFFFAGGPGQSAIENAGSVARMLGRLSNRRDIVLIDQRGTGRSAPLVLRRAQPDAAAGRGRGPGARCRPPGGLPARRLQKLPHGDLRHYTTVVAMQDADAVRRQLGADAVNVVGGSYGTRAALDYMRQFPRAVRRAVIDGVAPPDMVLPASFSTDNQAALDAVFTACEAQPACRARHPALRADWRALLATLPREVSVAHPVTGEVQRLTLTRDTLLGLVRTPLYVPALASALPLALAEAARGRFEPLVGLATALSGGRTGTLAEGMHFSVVCAEDVPRLAQSADRPGADFGDAFADLYRRACAGWPRGAVPAAFYTLPPAPAATLVLSGGADPVTPPRHGARVAQALGRQGAARGGARGRPRRDGTGLPARRRLPLHRRGRRRRGAAGRRRLRACRAAAAGLRARHGGGVEMIEVQQLSKRFTQGRGAKARSVLAVDGVSFTAADGRITGLLGPNGAGKTTTLRIAAALIDADAGRVQVDGIDVATRPTRSAGAHGRAQRRARPVPAPDGAREHRLLRPPARHDAGPTPPTRAEALARMLDMQPLLDRRTDGFSQGERMKTALARALVHDPANIVLDEPTNGLDVLATRSLRDTLRRLRDEQGKCIVFSTHIMQEVERLCDQVVVVSHGRTVAVGSVAELNAASGHADFEETFVDLAFSADDRQQARSPGVPHDGRSLDGVPEGVGRRAARPAHAARGAAQLGGHRPGGAGADLAAGGAASRSAPRRARSSCTASSTRRRCATTSSARPTRCARRPRATSSRSRTAGSATRCWWCRRTSRPISRAARRRCWNCWPAPPTSARRPAAGRCVRLLRGFNQEQATLRLAVRGVSPAALEALRIEERDLADPASRAAQLSTMVPFFVLMAVLYGALERGAGHHRGRARARLAGAAADEPGAARWRWCWASGARWPAWAS